MGRRIAMGRLWAGRLVVAVLVLAASSRSISAQAPQFTVNHPPRLQLGDAPLEGYPGGSEDRAQIIWQTIPAGNGSHDGFEAHYRRVGGPSWIDAGSPSMMDTGTGGRINHFVDIIGLRYDTEYEYRVLHLRGPHVVASWQRVFRTRLPAGDKTPFVFAAYGDSAYTSVIQGFRGVQNRINILDPSFALLLGDNCYYSGAHDEMGARFDAKLNPEAYTWVSEHIDFLSFGNHDLDDGSGRPTEDNFAVPIPVDGLTAPAEPPADERDEHNYGFDYGMAHFMTFDTNSLSDARRLDGQLRYIEAEMAAVSATWKIVFGHHPVGGGPDKYEGPGDFYFQQVVPRLRAAGVDLFLVGHSHTFSWSYPLIGAAAGEAIFLRDLDKDYGKGDGLVQVVSGLGGKSLRTGTFDQYPFIARGFSTSTRPSAEFGAAFVYVNESQLTVRYIAADDGAVIDQFTISRGPAPSEVTIAAVDPTMREASGDRGAFRISRSDTLGELTVRFRVAGSATEGADYASIAREITLPDGVATTDVMVAALDDGQAEGAETIRLTIEPDGAYATRAPYDAVVTILDDEVSNVSIRIAATDDDAEENEASGAMYLDSTDIELTDDSSFHGDQLVGLRFQDVRIPRGATILRASIELTTDEADDGRADVRIYGQSADDAPAFAESLGDISIRTRTAARAHWTDIPPWRTLGERHVSPDLSMIVQEIVGRSGWAEGNAMAFLVEGSGERTSVAFDGDPGSAARLEIYFDIGPVPTLTPIAVGPPPPPPQPSPPAVTATPPTEPMRLDPRGRATYVVGYTGTEGAPVGSVVPWTDVPPATATHAPDRRLRDRER